VLEIAVLLRQLGDPVVGEFESATHGLGRGWGEDGIHAWSHPSVTGRVEGLLHDSVTVG